MDETWVVHKFGGTSVGNANNMRKCVEIIESLSESRIAIVVSALGGSPKVTDLLLDSVQAAAANNLEQMNHFLELVRIKHCDCISDLFQTNLEISNMLIEIISADLQDIKEILKAVSLMKVAHEQILELVSGYGEIWSAKIFSEVLNMKTPQKCQFLNARDVLIVEESQIGTTVLWDQSLERLTTFFERIQPRTHLVITGYIASTPSGVATTLKRDGSDFTASIFGKLLKASSVTIWTDVDGVYSADPRRVPEARPIPEVSYNEAIELAYFGAKIIHPKTMAPAISSQTPIYIRNTFHPDHPGTRIYTLPSTSTNQNTNNNNNNNTNNNNNQKPNSKRERSVCGFSTVDHIALINLIGNGMLGVPGIAHRLFGALTFTKIPVLFIAQASSEHNICFGTLDIHVEAAKNAIEETFFFELKQGYVSQIRVISNCSIIAAVGESMNNLPGVSGIFFGALGDASINVLSISQGCDERNLAAVVYTHQATRALRAVHSAFCLSSLEISIGLIGTGKVGSAVLQLFLEQSKKIGQRFRLDLKVRGIINSHKMILGEDLCSSLSSESISTAISSARSSSSDSIKRSSSHHSLHAVGRIMESTENQPSNLSSFIDHIRSGVTSHTILIDASTSQEVASFHPSWLESGLHIVTANKRGLATSLSLFNQIYSSVRDHNKMYMSEVTIGAALPIRTTLHDLLCSGDAIVSIEGLMSCTAGALLTDICGEDQLSFSQAVSKTFQTGLFEVDPFQDLEGTEAAQKLLILAREMGAPLSLEDVLIEPLATRRRIDDWMNLTNEFSQEDLSLSERAQSAAQRGCTLRYVQRILCDPPAEMGITPNVKATIQIEEVPFDSTLARVNGAIYHFSFHTLRYAQNPLIVQGPLSDSANTASGIMGDVLRIARSLGARDRGPDSDAKHN